MNSVACKPDHAVQYGLLNGIGGSVGLLSDGLDRFFIEVFENPVGGVDSNSVWLSGEVDVIRCMLEEVDAFALPAKRLPEPVNLNLSAIIMPKDRMSYVWSSSC